MKKIHSIVFTFSVLLSSVCLLTGANIQTGENISINTAQKENNYLAGGKIFLQSIIDGDVIAAGGEITQRDSLLKDALLLGGTVTVNGPVAEDLRILGGSIKLFNSVSGDLIIVGGDIHINEGVLIKQDLIILSGNLRMDGQVQGNVLIAGGEVVLNGPVAGNLELRSGQVRINGPVKGSTKLIAQSITLGPKAYFEKDVQYYSPQTNLDFEKVLGPDATATFDETLKREFYETDWEENVSNAFWGIFIYRILSAILLIILTLSLFSNFFFNASKNLKDQAVNNLGVGTIYVLIVPVLIFLIFMTVIGIPAALILMSFYGISLSLAHVFASIIGAYTLREAQQKNWSKGQMMLVSILLYMALKLVSIIPLLGWFIAFIVTVVALGTLIQYLRKKQENINSNSEILT